MTASPPRSRRRSREMLWIAFFVGLALLEIGHGLHRLSTARARSHEQLLSTVIARGQDDLATRLAALIEAPEDHARYLASMPVLARFVDDHARSRREATDGAVESRARDELEKHLLSYLVTYPTIDRIRVVSARDGAEWARCERVGTLGGVCAIPPRALRTQGDRAIVTLGRSLIPGEVGRTDLLVDADRVEVPPSDRQIFHCVVPVPGTRGGRRDAAPTADAWLVVTVYAAPLLGAVRSFAPIPGIETALIDRAGTYLAHSARDHERSGAPDLAVDHPAVAARILAGEERVVADGTVFLARSVGGRDGWRFLAVVPEASLDAASGGYRATAVRIIGSMVAITAVIAVAALFFVRLGRRALELEERERHQRLEERLRISERLGALGLITAGVAHEINNPLAGISNYLALLDREGVPPEKRAEYLASVRHGFERIRAIARDLSSVSKGAPGDATGSAAVDLRAVLDRASALGRYDPQLRDVAVDVGGDPGAWRVRGESGRLEQVFLNLLLNGARAMEGSGTLHVVGRRAVRGGDAFVEVAIEDEGPGISPEHLDRLFEPFFTTEDEGLGLGLAISRGIIVAHGGAIEVENRAEGGARFRIRLPAEGPSVGDAARA